MQLSTRARYAVRAMMDLALNGEEGQAVTRDQIAKRQNLSPLYLSHLLLRLSKSGLIRSAKGPGGGYYLAKDASDISVGDIVRAVGESLSLVSCVADEESCEAARTCAAHKLWERLAEIVNETLDSLTLADMVEETVRLEAEKERALEDQDAE